jgi:hypothetical protein
VYCSQPLLIRSLKRNDAGQAPRNGDLEQATQLNPQIEWQKCDPRFWLTRLAGQAGYSGGGESKPVRIPNGL